MEGLHRIAPEVDMNCLCALGWCLGGHSVLELGRMQVAGMKAMITFHGVFDGVPPPEQAAEGSQGSGTEVLICNGELDPFVDKETQLKNAMATLESHGHSVRLLSLEGAKHGYTNPAQDYNPNEAFEFHEAAAQLAWLETLSLLKRTMS